MHGLDFSMLIRARRHLGMLSGIAQQAIDIVHFAGHFFPTRELFENKKEALIEQWICTNKLIAQHDSVISILC